MDSCDRLAHVIKEIQIIHNEARASIEKYKAGLPVLEIKEGDDGEEKKMKNEDGYDGTRMPLVVLWFETPLFYWLESTYAIFMVSFIVSFFNPHHRMEGENQEMPSKKEIKQIGTQFGRILKFIHRESDIIAPYFTELWQHGDYTGKDWRLVDAFSVYKRLIDVWSSVLSSVDQKGNDKDQKSLLFECVMNKNPELLQKGIGVSPLLARMLLHYYNAKLNDLAGSLYMKSIDAMAEKKKRDEEEEEEAKEETK